MRYLCRLLICAALAAIGAGCVPIGVKGSSLPYASASAVTIGAPAR